LFDLIMMGFNSYLIGLKVLWYQSSVILRFKESRIIIWYFKTFLHEFD
jgi:hypothetical protein